MTTNTGNKSMKRWHDQAVKGDFACNLGARKWVLKPGYSSCELVVRPRHTNLNNVVHGGVMYSIADTGMGGALSSTLKKDEVCATVEMKMNFLASVTRGVIHQETRMVHRGKRFAVFVSEVKDSAGRLAALATGTFAIMKKRRAKTRA